MLNLLGKFYRIAQLSEKYGESTLPILIYRKVNAGVVIENVCIVTRVGIYNGNPLGKGYISPCIPPLATIQFQYWKLNLNILMFKLVANALYCYCYHTLSIWFTNDIFFYHPFALNNYEIVIKSFRKLLWKSLNNLCGFSSCLHLQKPGFLD